MSRDLALSALALAGVNCVCFAADQDAYECGRDAITAAYPDAFTGKTNRHGSPDVDGECESVFVDSTFPVLVSPPIRGHDEVVMATGGGAVAQYDQALAEAAAVVRDRAGHGILVYGIYRDALGNLGREAVFAANPSDREGFTVDELTWIARRSLSEVGTFWATMIGSAGVAE